MWTNDKFISHCCPHSVVHCAQRSCLPLLHAGYMAMRDELNAELVNGPAEFARFGQDVSFWVPMTAIRNYWRVRMVHDLQTIFFFEDKFYSHTSIVYIT